MVSRRAFLAGAGATMLAGCISDDEYYELEEELETAEAEIEALKAENEALYEQLNTPDHDFSEDEIRQAETQAAEVRSSVVFVDSGMRGTGFAYDERKYLTAEHVIARFGADKLYFLDHNPVSFEYIDSESVVDAAILEASAMPTLELGSIDDVSQGDPLFLVSNPMHVGDWITTLGRYEGPEDETFLLDDLHRVSAPVARQSSGAPVFTMDGTVVGMAVLQLDPHDGHRAPDDVYTSFDDDPECGFVSIDAINEHLL